MKFLKMLCIVVLAPILVAWAPHEGDEAWDGVNNASPPGIGANLPIRSRNIEVLGHLSIAEMGASGANVFGNDCWGWTDSMTGKEYALVGLRHRTAFVDISDPTNPQYLGFLPTENGLSTWRDMKVYNAVKKGVSQKRCQEPKGSKRARAKRGQGQGRLRL